MLTETVFRSADLAPAERFECWRELVGQTHAPLDVRSDHRADFRVSQRVLKIGEVSVWPTTFQPVCFRRTPKLIQQSDPEGLHISLPLSGPLRAVRGKHSTVHGPDSLCVVDTSQPIDVYGGDDGNPHTGIGVEVPKALLSLPRAQVDQATRLQLSAHEGFGYLLAQLLTQLKSSQAYQPIDGHRLEGIVVDLVSALIAQASDAGHTLPAESRQRVLAMHIRAFIKHHLHDPHLTLGAIASAHHISLSYLHRLFSEQGETITALIRRQRLEGARRDLADPAQLNTPVHSIAARWGFTHHAAFTRAFRATYHLAPRDYRHQVHTSS